MMVTISSRNVVLMMKNLEAGVDFYRNGIGLRLLRSTPAMAEFDTGGKEEK